MVGGNELITIYELAFRVFKVNILYNIIKVSLFKLRIKVVPRLFRPYI